MSVHLASRHQDRRFPSNDDRTATYVSEFSFSESRRDSHACLPPSTFDHLPPFLAPRLLRPPFRFFLHQRRRKGRPRSRSLSSYAKNAALRCYHGIRAIHRPLAAVITTRTYTQPCPPRSVDPQRAPTEASGRVRSTHGFHFDAFLRRSRREELRVLSVGNVDVHGDGGTGYGGLGYWY